MNKSLIIIVLLALAAITNAGVMYYQHYLPFRRVNNFVTTESDQQKQCGRFAEFLECAEGCPVTCENAFSNTLNKCQCRPGCQCLEGYVFEASGSQHCVKKSECNVLVVKCTTNMMYSQEPSNELTCQGDQVDTTGPDCICKEGYVRKFDGVCVTPDEC